MARVQIPISFSYQGSYYVATSSAGSPTTQVAIQLPASGSTVTVTNRVTNQPAIVYSSSTGTGTISPVITDTGGNVPGWVPEGSYTLSAAASGSFAGAIINWEAVYGAGVSNVAATVGGDLSGTLPNPTVSTVQGGRVPVTSGQSAGGDLVGTYPNPTVSNQVLTKSLQLLVPRTLDLAGPFYSGMSPTIQSGTDWAAPPIAHGFGRTPNCVFGSLYDGYYSSLCSWRQFLDATNVYIHIGNAGPPAGGPAGVSAELVFYVLG